MEDSMDTKPTPKKPGPSVIRPLEPTTPIEEVSGVLKEIGDHAVTARAHAIRHNTDEAMVWQAKPSLLLLIAPALRYALLFVAALVVIRFAALQIDGAPSPARDEAPQRHAPAQNARQLAAQAQAAVREHEQPIGRVLDYAPLVVAAYCALRLGIVYLRLATTKYYATSQRLVVETGVLHSVSQPYELHSLSNATIVRPLLLRPAGVANIFIGAPPIALLGVKNADYVRDLLRTGGQLEAQRIDKIRWR
jgi:hypothetical protein